jgi:hypothetical protein
MDAASEEELFGDMVTDSWIDIFLMPVLRVDVFFFAKVDVFDFCFFYFVAG